MCINQERRYDFKIQRQQRKFICKQLHKSIHRVNDTLSVEMQSPDGWNALAFFFGIEGLANRVDNQYHIVQSTV